MSKFQRNRAKEARLVRIWAPDVPSPGFAEEAARQAKLLENKPEQTEATDFIMSSFAWPRA